MTHTADASDGDGPAEIAAARTGRGPVRWRRHQALALAALDEHWTQGHRRAWVELPPGAGKTLVGVETAHRMLADGRARRVLVLGPNTAIQQQWIHAGRSHGLSVAAERSLTADVSALTYQSLAVFDADLEVDDDGREQPLSSRLHENGRALVAAMRTAGPLLLVLDECHHLLQVWGRLLGELLEDLPEARVLGLTATPPEALTADEAALVAGLFGSTVFAASLPAVVREGDLAPFAELAWLVSPTPAEADWLAEQAQRFQALVTQLTDPEFGSLPFLAWIDARFLAPGVGWVEVVRGSPELARAALRLHHAGMLALPEGARLTEEHRVAPSADDWVLLVEDWLTRGLARTDDPADAAVIDAVRRALPSVGYAWTRRGIRRGRSPVDRVLARSAAKTTATVQIVGIEHRNLSDRMRMLVLCDHERASATLPADLRGVIDAQSGSAHAVLAALLADPAAARLSPVLVTGSIVAAAPEVLARLRTFVAATDPELAAGLVVQVDDGTACLTGTWGSRQWVGHVTRFFHRGGTQVLVGTRGLLGEGWDARWVTGLVDLTAVTTTTAVVQTRGRALRTDPEWPEKVALTWSVVCVAPDHPKGDNDWDRLVRKHTGFYGVDRFGDVVDGVGHLDPSFSPYAPPPVETFEAVNAAMARRSEDRPAIAALWRVGDPYSDRVSRSLRLLPSARSVDVTSEAAQVVVAHSGAIDLRGAQAPHLGHGERLLLGSGAVGLAGWAATTAGVVAVAGPVPGALAVGAIAALVASGVTRARSLVAFGRGVIDEAARPPGVGQVARAVADALADCGLVSVGAPGVRVDVEPDGSYRCSLAGVSEEESALFATALDEALSPIATHRYLVPRWSADPRERGWVPAAQAAFGRVRRPAESWHPVPTILGVNARRAGAYGIAWRRWVGGGEPIYSGSPEGAGILAAQQGADPFDVTSVMRRHWT